MKTFTAILAFPLIIVLPYYLSVVFSQNQPETVNTSENVTRMIETVEAFLNYLSSLWVLIGALLAYIIARYTFGRRLLNSTSYIQFIILSLIPVVAISLAFLFKEPGLLLAILTDNYGTMGKSLFVGIIFTLCLSLHLMTITMSKLNKIS